MAKRKQIGKKLRFEVLSRDAFSCQYCGSSGPGVKLHVDHVRPVSKGGKNELSNLVTACSDCNIGKGADTSHAAAIERELVGVLNMLPARDPHLFAIQSICGILRSRWAIDYKTAFDLVRRSHMRGMPLYDIMAFAARYSESWAHFVKSQQAYLRGDYDETPAYDKWRLANGR